MSQNVKNVKSPAEAIDFIRKLKLRIPKLPGGIAEPAATASVVDGAATVFVGDLSGQAKVDVQNSVLLAQLGASAKYDREDQITEWYEYYSEILLYCGWTYQSFSFDRFSDANQYGSVDKVVIALAEAYLSGGALSLFKATITSMGDAKNEDAALLFDHSAAKNTKSNFQLGVANRDNDNTSLSVGYFTYTVEQNITKVLFFEFGSQSVLFEHGNQVMVLNEDHYAGVRDTVEEKLGVSVTERIRNIVI
ncbi:hypothetical protein DFH06DRAFT_1296284 [Mycena polygramma]|nr:hypothetical protein DFH06DRAFT_1296280 [Mycena polygramma]KAJ7662684.1 hypothetical protein DFH06DRAFT_1471462 [Mycena polygramma]KAJ7662686.1 hypothetical protein DFH06DRAFT_1296284 [Mycena polygramma]